MSFPPALGFVATLLVACRVGFVIPRTGVSGFVIRQISLFKRVLSYMFSESPFGLADSEIRIPHCAGLQIRRSVSAGGGFWE